MNAAPDDNDSANSDGDGAGVLSQLPRTRPQRASARRAAARKAPQPPPAKASTAAPERPKAAKPAGKAAKPKRSTGTRASSPKARKPATKARAASAGTGAARRPAGGRSRRGVHASERDPAPRQGYAAEGERVRGPVQPPGNTELIASAAELVGELAKAGVSTGERLLRSLISRS